MRAMSLAAKDGSDEQQNDLRNFQAQLEITNKMIETLSRQLNELRDQVHFNKFYFAFFFAKNANNLIHVSYIFLLPNYLSKMMEARKNKHRQGLLSTNITITNHDR